MRPTAVVDELILGQTEALHVIADLFRHSGVGGEKVKQAAMVVLEFLGQFIALRIAGFGPLPTQTGQVSAEGSGVEVPLVVGQLIVLGEPTKVHVVAIGEAGFDESHDQLVALRVVVRWRIDGDLVVWIRRQAEPIAVGLNAGSGFALNARFAFVDQWEQSALWATDHHIGIEWEIAIPHALTSHHTAIFSWHQVTRTRSIFLGVVDAVVGLAILGIALAHQSEAHPRLGHEVALVGGVDEDFGRKFTAVLGDQSGDSRTVLRRRLQPRVALHIHTRLLAHLVEELLGLVWLDGVGSTGGWPTALVFEGFVPSQFHADGGRELGEVFACDAAD